MEEDNNRGEISLRQIFKILLDKKKFIIIITLICLCLGFIYSIYSFVKYVLAPLPVPPVLRYSSTVTIILSKPVGSDGKPSSVYDIVTPGSNININMNEMANATDTEQMINLYDETLNQRLVATYTTIMKSKTVLKQIISDLGLTRADLSIKPNDDKTLIENALAGTIGVGAVAGTEIINISVNNERADLAAAIANHIPEVFGKVIKNIYHIDNVYIVDPAEVAADPYNAVAPQIKDYSKYLKTNIKTYLTKNMLLPAVGGFVLALVIILFLYYFDNTVKTSDEIENYIGLKSLSVVPLCKTN